MKKFLISGSLFAISAGVANAGPAAVYNQPQSAYRQATSAYRYGGDMMGTLPPVSMRQPRPLVTKSAPLPPPPALPAPSWTNLYVGVNIGAGWTNTGLNALNLANFNGVGMWGVTGGITGGFDYQFAPQFVAGIMAEGNISGVDAKASIAGVAEADFRESASWTLRGRLGTLTSEETLIYVTAGFSEAFTRLSFPNTPGLRGGGATYAGAVFGAGIETRLDGGLYGRFEYIHGLYDRHQFANGLYSATPETGLARVGLIFKPAEYAASGVSTTPPLRENWTGPYIGLQGGWGWETTAFSGPLWSADGVGGSGPIGGGLIGYEYQLGSGVVALEADGSGAGFKSSLSALNRAAQLTYDWDYSIRARAGRLFGNTLAFASVGWSQMGGELTTVRLGGLQTSHVFSGVQFGGGLETMLTGHIAARLEYLQTFYDKYASILGAPVDARPAAGKTRAALVYKF